jgi:hypothetical protein
MPVDEPEGTIPTGLWSARGVAFGLVVVSGVGLAITVRGYLSPGSKWDRFVREPAVVGWLTSFVVLVSVLVCLRWIRRGGQCLVVALAVSVFAIGGGTAMGRSRLCDTKKGRAFLVEVVGFTSAIEPAAVLACSGQDHIRLPRWSSELSPRSIQEHRRIVEFLDQHGLVDLDSSTSFTAAFDGYTIEVEMPQPNRSGHVVVTRARP